MKQANYTFAVWFTRQTSRSIRRQPRRLSFDTLEDRVTPSVTITGVTSLHAGDRVQIAATLSNTDTNENGEGEPLQVSAGGAAIMFVPQYDQTVTKEYLAKTDQSITAFISGEDGDESATVNVTLITNQQPRFSQAEKDAFNKISADYNIEAAKAAIVTGALGILSGLSAAGAVLTAPTGAGPALFGAASAGLAVDAGMAGTLSGYFWLKSAEYQKLALDPPDPNFTTVAQPVVHTLTLSLQKSDPSVTPQQLATLQALLDNNAQELAVAQALNTAVNRASGAQQAGDQVSLALQLGAVSTFGQELSAILAAQPALLTAAQQVFTTLAAGKSTTVTAAQVLTFEQQVQLSGFLPQFNQVMKLAGATDTDISHFAKLATDQDTSVVAGDLISTLFNNTSTQQDLKAFTSALLGTSPTTTKLTAGKLSAGHNITLNAVVSSGTAVVPLGTVTFMDNNVPLKTVSLDSHGKASAILKLPPGPNHLTAVYNPLVDFKASKSKSIAITVTGRPTAQLTSSAKTSVAGQPVTLTLTFGGPPGSGAPSGLIGLLDGTQLIGFAHLKNGVAKFVLNHLSIGKHTFVATFAGGQGLSPGSFKMVQTVTLVTSEPDAKHPGKSVLVIGAASGVFSIKLTASANSIVVDLTQQNGPAHFHGSFLVAKLSEIDIFGQRGSDKVTKVGTITVPIKFVPVSNLGADLRKPDHFAAIDAIFAEGV